MNLICPDCKSDNIKNEGDGIISCKKCENIFDSGPQWRKYKPQKEITNISENSVIENKFRDISKVLVEELIKRNTELPPTKIVKITNLVGCSAVNKKS